MHAGLNLEGAFQAFTRPLKVTLSLQNPLQGREGRRRHPGALQSHARGCKSRGSVPGVHAPPEGHPEPEDPCQFVKGGGDIWVLFSPMHAGLNLEGAFQAFTRPLKVTLSLKNPCKGVKGGGDIRVLFNPMARRP